MPTKIEWADEVWNPITGCTPTSEGCRNCYAASMAKRFWGDRKFSDVQLHMERLEKPMRWKRPRRVFVDSMGDLFHEDVSDEQIAAVFGAMSAAPRHTFLVLTKRPRRMKEWFSWAHHRAMSSGLPWRDGAPVIGYLGEYALRASDGRINIWKKDVKLPDWPLTNVCLGVSIGNQDTANERLISLRDTPAAVRFVSYEPATGAWDPRRTYAGRMNINALSWLDWVVMGGETGVGARPMHPDWVRSVRDQCQESGTPFMFKQWGEWAPDCLCQGPTHENKTTPRPSPGLIGCMFRCGKKSAGRELDGRTWEELPKGMT